ncbi:IS66 family insertion sequence element accessory protein TnpB, partial [Sphingobium sp. SA916]|uniref:IS66 family insertion sequence element accessory protein TnpB n=1 Tax=Sphingobium sp. SA916 TaxID=1851207 RepID=UPI0011AF26E2
MFGDKSDLKVVLVTGPIDFRAGINRLSALVAHELGRDPYSSDIFVFRSKRAHLPTFRIRFASRYGRLPLASVFRNDDAGGAVPPGQASQAC